MKQKFSYLDILSLIENRERNALLPQIGEKCLQSSSTDSRSQYDPETDTYHYWDGNNDGCCYHGALTDEFGLGYIALDVKGAGYISTIWFGTLNDGCIDVYIDGKRFDNGSRRARDIFEAKGKFAGLDGLIYNTPGPAWIFDLPLTFNESCRIIMREGWGLYFHVDYTLFPEGTEVESFPMDFSPEQRQALEALSARFADPHGFRPAALPATSFTVPAHGSLQVYETAGTGALGNLQLTVADFEKMDKAQQEKIALGLTLSAYWDGEKEPSVWSPIGGFFGTPLADPFDSFTLGLTENGMYYNRFLMPYADGAKIVLENETDEPVSVTFAAEKAELHYPIENYTRFHAKWSRNAHPVLRPDRFPDHTLLKTQGRGRYIGVSFHAYEREDYGWWGEGDEKIFVDYEKYPSWFGTGSEDYFGFCWGKPIMFQRPWHAQLRQDGGFYGAGHKVDLRLHQADSIPFAEDIEVTIEKYLEEEKVSYDCVTYWYLSTDGTDDYTAVPLRARTDYYAAYKSVPVESIQLRHKEVTLNVNDECRIVWNVLPADTSDTRPVVWTSCDPEAVSVDSRGQILALKPGVVRLIASIGRVKASCLVTVNGEVVPKAEPTAFIQEHTVGLYRFNDPKNPGKDESGKGNDLTYYTKIDGAYGVYPEAARFVPAQEGKRALYFDGITFLLREAGVGSEFDRLHNFTVTYRSHMPAYGADATREMKRNYKTIIDKGGFTAKSGWCMCSENDTQVAANEFINVWGNTDLVFNPVNAPYFVALTWSRITFTVNADTGRIAVFHNDSLLKETVVDTQTLHPENTDHPFTLGGAITVENGVFEFLNNSGFVGELTDIRLLDCALSDDEIKLLDL